MTGTFNIPTAWFPGMVRFLQKNIDLFLLLPTFQDGILHSDLR